MVFELRPDMAPKMADNFIKLCKGLPDGRGYKGSKIFRAKANDHILGGDFENDDGTGGHSAYEEKYFLAEHTHAGPQCSNNITKICQKYFMEGFKKNIFVPRNVF